MWRQKKPLIWQELLMEQAVDSKYQAATQTVGHPAPCFVYEGNGILIKIAPVRGVLSKVVPVTLRAHVFYLPHYPTLANTLGRDIFTPRWKTLLLATQSKWCEHTFTQMLLVIPEWISNDAQDRGSASPNCGNPWATFHCHFWTATKVHAWKMPCH